MKPETTEKTFMINGHKIQAQPLPGGLYLVATPLGNLSDISLRALSVIAAVDTVLCEDTRVSSRLLQRYGIEARLRPYHDHNAASVRPFVLETLSAGAAIALISDAGMPMVNDPGYKLVRDCIQQGISVDVIPGPTAPVTALALSGLPTDRFMFAGFLPAKAAARIEALNGLAIVQSTIVVFESTARIEATLAGIEQVMPARQVAVAREMTKLHQEVLRGTASEIRAGLAHRPPLKGEITIVIDAPCQQQAISDDELQQQLVKLLKDHPASKAATILAKQTGRPKSQIYDLAVGLKGRP